MEGVDSTIPIGFYPSEADLAVGVDVSPYSALDKRALAVAKHVSECSLPMHKDVHLVELGKKTLLFVVNGSQVKLISNKIADNIRMFIAKGDEENLQHQLDLLDIELTSKISDEPLIEAPIHALSLAIAQKCNMGCSYCYAEQGDFGGAAQSMDLDTAKQAIQMLIGARSKGDKVNIAFMGGEPLMNRPAIIAATEYAVMLAEKQQVKVAFSITTNGTLVNIEDGEFFERFGFAVTVSLDGIGEVHDKLRPMKAGSGSFERIIKRIKPLLEMQNNMQISARVTVTPDNLALGESLDELIAMGFHSVGFSPLLNSSNGQGQMDSEHLQAMLGGMISCGLQFEQNTLQGKAYPFLNLLNAHKEIGKSTHRPYPCGAGAGYLGVSAQGELSACHRFVNDEQGQLGDIHTGVDKQAQASWLAERHVSRQSPCTSCWARYMCAGGCHHEVIEKGRESCDYIRSWLHYCLQSYARLKEVSPNSRREP